VTKGSYQTAMQWLLGMHVNSYNTVKILEAYVSLNLSQGERLPGCVYSSTNDLGCCLGGGSLLRS
jgi:hypothetical protein